ncbi:hypothetical protein [Sphingobium cloacae]|uniref:DUF2971 domain-containing protein n=1 Tax=Sphingobium cloacae TaxID=120107 RepID=A0A1E1F2G0_9SPHN|nr:hypothetical protein [Sphingobium cloacae]BAV64705.1 hypothetical protein SCLO_1016650 [Sphingobium cloacae]
MAEWTSNTLKRFTSLAVALDMLVSERLTLLSPATWEDRNDIAFLEAYRARRGVRHVFAMCFTQAPETFHHWGVFARGMEGVRVDLDKRALLTSLRDRPCFVWNDVQYKTLDQLDALEAINVYDLPFLKRHAFRDEREFRLLCESDDPAAQRLDVPIDRAWIKGISASPWMPENLFQSIKSAIRALPGCGKLRFQRTTLRENDRWKTAVRKIVDGSIAAGSLPRNPIGPQAGRGGRGQDS